MKALHVSEAGEPSDVLRVAECAIPEPGPHQILVRVRAAALNYPDVLLCRGQYQVRPEFPFTPGFELCGDVVTVSDSTTEIRVGDRVIGRAALPYGGFADYALMDGDVTFPAPPELDDAQCAAMHVAYQTGWFALHTRAHLQPGETLLVHAAAGGVGSAAVQLGKAAGARVIAVVGSPRKLDIARALGADLVIDRSSVDFAHVVREATDGRGADVIFDPVGGDTYDRSTKCIAFEGRIILVGFAGGRIQTAALNHPLLKNYSIIGLHWGLYESREPDTTHQCHEELSRMAAAGIVRPLVSEQIDLGDVPARLQQLAHGATTGRVVSICR